MSSPATTIQSLVRQVHAHIHLRLASYALLLVLAVYWVGWLVYTRFFHPLSKIPGPFLASVSRFWLVYQVHRGNIEHVQRSLHKRHGSLVRIAPDEVICADPEALRTIYPTQAPPVKTDFYPPWGYPGLSKYADIFSETNEQLHSQRRRIVNHVFSLSTVLTLEGYINKCSDLFIKQMGEYADSQSIMDLGEWVQWYAFDVMGELFFGRMFGFLEDGCDYGSYIEALDIFLPFITQMTLTPKPFRPLWLIWAMLSPAARKASKTMPAIAALAKTCVADRLMLETEHGNVKSDLLQHLLGIMQSKGQKVDFGIGEVQLTALTALFAGSDTTAIAMRACFYFLLKHPDVYENVQAELDEASARGELSNPVRFAEAQKLPLFCATVKEAMRLHPAVGLQIPRVVPPGGLEIAGTYIPAGYRVGMNAAVLGYNEQVYGPDASQFRPTRWLEGNSARLDRNTFVFGAGTRTCIGKNISLAEIHKLLPQVLLQFKIQLAEPHKTWQTSNFWFNKQTGINVRLSRR